MTPFSPPDPYREVLGDPYAILGTDGSVDVLVDDQGLHIAGMGLNTLQINF